MGFWSGLLIGWIVGQVSLAAVLYAVRRVTLNDNGGARP